MKPCLVVKRFFLFFIPFLMLSGCGLPLTKSLLSDFNSQCSGSNCSTTDSGDVGSTGALEIQANGSTSISLPIEQSDVIEVNGTCNDLGRKNNRILVEVFAGEDEATDPFINNAVTQNCLNTTSPLQSGLTAASGRCLWVTNGLGRIEDAGLPNERIFPQCHNGKFGFSVRLGRVLQGTNPGDPNFKYLIRFKLRTQETTISDTPWSKVVVDRSLTVPSLTATHTPNQFNCVVKANPARFNLGVLYTLSKTYTDIVSTNAPIVPNIYTNLNTSVITPQASIFEWNDTQLTDGVTYNYTLVSTEANYTYVTNPTATSTVATCETKRIYIEAAAQPTANTCYFQLFSTSTDAIRFTQPNPYVTYEWGYAAAPAGNSSWIGVGENDGKTLVPPFAPPSCGNSPICTATGLTAGTTYFFAVRARNLTTGAIGKWSQPISCRPP